MAREFNPILGGLHDHGIDITQRRVFLTGPVQDSSIVAESDGEAVGFTDAVVLNLLWLDSHGEGDIELWINTPGGDFLEMWAIHDVIRTMKNKVNTIGYGQVASAGCLLLACGTGKRWCMPNSWFMWHGGSESFFDLRPREAQQRAKWMEDTTTQWVNLMAKYTEKPASFWRAKCHDYELWLDAHGMLEHGIVDFIWEEPAR